MSSFRFVAAATATESTSFLIYLFYLPAWYVRLRENYLHPPAFSSHLSVVNRYTCPDWLLTNVGPLLPTRTKKERKKKDDLLFLSIRSNSAEFIYNYMNSGFFCFFFVFVFSTRNHEFSCKNWVSPIITHPHFLLIHCHSFLFTPFLYLTFLPSLGSSMWKDPGRPWSRSLNDLQAKNINLWNDFTDSEVGTIWFVYLRF